MPVQILSNDLAFRAALGAHLAANLGDAAGLLRDAIKEAIATPGPPRSRPGEAPHVDTGRLRESIDHSEVDASTLSVTVGTDVPYAPILETAMNRPFLLSTLINISDELAREICKS